MGGDLDMVPWAHQSVWAVFVQCTAESLYFTIYWSPPFPLKLSLRMGDLDSQSPHPIHGSSGPPESTPKRHFDPFSRFCRAHDCETDRPTDRQTDHATSSVAIGRI